MGTRDSRTLHLKRTLTCAHPPSMNVKVSILERKHTFDPKRVTLLMHNRTVFLVPTTASGLDKKEDSITDPDFSYKDVS